MSTKTGGTYSVNTTTNAPSVTGLTYADTNTTTKAITENDQQIIRNKSTVRYTVTGAAAKNSATVASVKVTVNGLTYTLSASGSSYVGGNAVINSASNVTATATVTDSRGLTATTTVMVQMLDWIKPTAIINMQRLNNFYSTTNITVDADYSSLDGKNTITITYRAGIQGSGAYTVTGTLQDNVQGSFDADNEQNWSVQVTVQDLFDSTTYTLSLSRGIPIVFYDVDKSSVGINTFPSHDNSLEGLDIYMNGVGVMGIKATLGSTEDLNDIIAQGIYYQPANANATTAHNYPVSYAGYLEVFNAGDNIVQRYTAYHAPNNASPAIYYRSYYVSSWRSWLTTSDYETTSQTGTGEGYVFHVGRLQICILNTTKNNIAISNSYGSLYVGSYVWTFPKPFASAPSVTCGSFIWGTGSSWGLVRASTTTSATLYGMDAFKRASGTNVYIQATAIGFSEAS